MTNNLEMPTKKKKRAASLDKKKARAGWIFILPFVIGFVLIYIPILYESLKMSLTHYDKGVYVFRGWQVYYEALFETVGGVDFLEVLVTGISEMVLDIPMILMFSLFMAILLNQKMAGRAAFRAIFFVPVILSTGIMDAIDAGAIDQLMGDSGGIDDGTGKDSVEGIVSAVDVEKLFAGSAIIGEDMLMYVTDTINRIYDIVNRSGVQMLIFLAGLQSISPAIYESVQIDGATAWETFWKITFPMISPMILVNAVYTLIDAFTGESAVMTYITNASASVGINISTAMAWIYFLIVILLMLVVVGICSAYVFYQKKN